MLERASCFGVLTVAVALVELLAKLLSGDSDVERFSAGNLDRESKKYFIVRSAHFFHYFIARTSQSHYKKVESR